LIDETANMSNFTIDVCAVFVPTCRQQDKAKAQAMSDKVMDKRIREQSAVVKGHAYLRFVVDHGTVNGKRTRKSFKSQAKAERYLRDYDQQQEVWQEKQGILRRRIGEDAGKLSNQQLRQALEAFHSLGDNTTITEAVRFYLEHGQLKNPRTVKDFHTDYLHFREVTKRRRPRTIQEIRFRIGRFVNDFGSRLLHSIGKIELQAWMEKQGGSGINQHHYRAQLSAFFKRAVVCGHVSEKLNPARGLEVPDLEKTVPYVMPVKDVEKLLKYTANNEPAMIPYIALCLFAGIRPMECERLTWDRVNFDTKRIRIDAATSKTKQERYVDMSDNLLSWLLRFPHSEEKMHYSRKAFQRIRSKCDVQWKSDCMRHSFGTYHVKLYENAGKTALQMGHRNTGILFDHYLNAKFTQQDAQQFFDLSPDSGAKVIPFSAIA
jgi:integrase